MNRRTAFREYAEGVLRSARFIAEGHGESGMAAELISNMLHGERVEWMQRLAASRDIQFKRSGRKFAVGLLGDVPRATQRTVERC